MKIPECIQQKAKHQTRDKNIVGSHSSSPSARLVRLHSSSCLKFLVVFMHVLVFFALLLTALALMIKCFLGLAVFLSGMIFVRRQQIQPVFRLYRDQDEWRLVAENAGSIDSSAKISTVSQKPNHLNVAKTWCFGSKKRLSPIYLIVVSLISTYFPSPWKLGSTYQIVSWSYCSQFLLIIRIETERNSLFYLPIMFDSCQQDEFRWLKVVVKYLL